MMNKKEKELDLLRQSVRTIEGWKNLAYSIKTSSNPKAKENCIKMLKEAFENKPIEFGLMEKQEVSFHDLLEDQLNKFIQEV